MDFFVLQVFNLDFIQVDKKSRSNCVSLVIDLIIKGVFLVYVVLPWLFSSKLFNLEKVGSTYHLQDWSRERCHHHKPLIGGKCLLCSFPLFVLFWILRVGERCYSEIWYLLDLYFVICDLLTVNIDMCLTLHYLIWLQNDSLRLCLSISL